MLPMSVPEFEVPTESPQKMLVVGGIAGAAECFAMQPVIYWKTVMQAKIKFRPGAMFNGVVVNAASIGPISALQYAGNGALLSLYFASNDTVAPTNSTQLGIAALAGALSSLITTPAELLMICQQRYRMSLKGTFDALVGSRGLPGLFHGLGPTVLREAGWTFGFLGLTPALKSALQEDSKFCRRNEVVASAIASVTAGIITTALTQPCDTVKTVVQASPGIVVEKSHARIDTAEAIEQLYNTGRFAGVSSFFNGFSARSVRCVGAIFILGQCQSFLSSALGDMGFH